MPSPSVEYGSLPFREQIDFFRGKLNLPTEAWDDVLGAAHDRAFVVAGAAKADLLTDLRGEGLWPSTGGRIPVGAAPPPRAAPNRAGGGTPTARTPSTTPTC